MIKYLVILCFSFSSFSQTEDYSFLNDYFFESEDGLMCASDIFIDYYYAGEHIPDEFKKKISKIVKQHKVYFDSQNSISGELMASYKQIIFLNEIINLSSLEYSEKIYELISDDIRYRSTYYFDVISSLVKEYNKTGRAHLSAKILEKEEPLLSNHKNFTCDTSSRYYYFEFASLYFDTYSILDNNKNITHYGFYYLLDSKDHSEKLIKVLIENYGKEDVKKAYLSLEKAFIPEPSEINSYFKFLDYKILVNGHSGIYPYYNKMKGTTNFEQLKSIWFYKHLYNHFSK